MVSSSRHPQTTRCHDTGVVLPRDVLYEILLRVPARSLCRFRLVCKSWRSLLSDDAPFAAAHAAWHPPLFAVVGASGTHGDAAEINLLDTFGRIVKRVSGGPSALLREMRPYQDLVLTRHIVGVKGDYCALRVLDPATGAAASVLPDDRGDFDSSFFFGRFATSSSKGTDDGEYKVLSLSLFMPLCKILTVDVNGAHHGSWRIVRTKAPLDVTVDTFLNGTVAKGVVYHLVDNTGDGWTMAAFDLAAEEWRPALIQGPAAEPSPGGSAWKRSLAEVNGRLAAVSSTVSSMDIWLLMSSGEPAMWCKQCRVLTSSIQRQHEVFADAQPLLVDDGRVALWVTSGRPARGAPGLWMYDPRTETCTEVVAMNNSLNVGVGIYTGNLLRQPQRAHEM